MNSEVTFPPVEYLLPRSQYEHCEYRHSKSPVLQATVAVVALLINTVSGSRPRDTP